MLLLLKNLTMEKPVYLDYNATTPVEKEVAEIMQYTLDTCFGNPSSSHWFGVQARKVVEEARKDVAALIHVSPDEIIFTSGGTESNNMAIKGYAMANKHKGRHIITSSIEHPAVHEVCKFLEQNGFEITYLPVDREGTVQSATLREAIRPDTILISVMHANNETGTIQPVREIGEVAKQYGIAFHCDAAQSAGKIPINCPEMGFTMLSIAGHKLYAPKGIGALYIRRGTGLEKTMHGADHEFNLRAGTENVPEIAGLGMACKIAAGNLDKFSVQMKRTSDELYRLLYEALPDIKLNGTSSNRLPNTLNISFPNIEADTLLSELQGIAASAGAACHSGDVEVSHVLEAMKVPVEYAMGAIRFSTGRHTTIGDVEKAAVQIIDAVKRLHPDDSILDAKVANEEIKLTRFTHGLGCACKMNPASLQEVLAKITVSTGPDVLVGSGTADDACVYRINEDTAIVQTVDFFTPVVDDPFTFGQIAAANALSDIYAMGGTPLFALNIAAFPSNRLPLSVLEEILKGAGEKAAEAGIPVLGGHTIDDNEPKFGMVVSGKIHPGKIVLNATAKPGDVLLLTKPVGTGIIATASKRGAASPEIMKQAVNLMSELNRSAAEIMLRYPVSACTDVTGFGLMGHLMEMSIGSGVNVTVSSGKVPVIYGVEELVRQGFVPGGTKSNLDFVKQKVEWDEAVSPTIRTILCDAQTSGGLLIAVPEKYAAGLQDELNRNRNTKSVAIGYISGPGNGIISVEA